MALIHVGFFSEALGMCASCDVILPQQSGRLVGMDTKSSGPHRVLWLLHGASDDETIWQRRTSIERYAAPLGLAVVMPSAHLSSYANMAHGGRYFTYIADELPRIMRGFSPLSPAREDNYIAGLSMGGSGSLKIGLARPENYAAIGCLSAGMSNLARLAADNPALARQAQMIYGRRRLEGTEEDIAASARRIVEKGQPAPRIYHACGTEDFVRRDALEARDFFRGFAGDPFDYVYDEGPGAHTWEFWDEHIQRFLAYLRLE